MAYNQYTPATTAYVEAAFKEYDTYVDTDVKGIRERLSSDEKNITKNAADIKTNTANIATNTANIATNTANIKANTANIATNASNIKANTANITKNAANIATNASNIKANTANIATNTANIATNASNIKANTANITKNAAGIATNASNIKANTANIATNASNISDLQAQMKTVSYTNETVDGVVTAMPSGQITSAVLLNNGLSSARAIIRSFGDGISDEQPTLHALTKSGKVAAIGNYDNGVDALGVYGQLLLTNAKGMTVNSEMSQAEQEADAKACIDELLGIETEEDGE